MILISVVISVFILYLCMLKLSKRNNQQKTQNTKIVKCITLIKNKSFSGFTSNKVYPIFREMDIYWETLDDNYQRQAVSPDFFEIIIIKKED